MSSTEMRRLLDLFDKDIFQYMAEKWLVENSPSYTKSKEIREIGSNVAYVDVAVGGRRVANVGPLDVRGAEETRRGIIKDIHRSYEKTHPHGFTDGSGAIYRKSDWTVDVKTCHSSQCSDIIKNQK